MSQKTTMDDPVAARAVAWMVHLASGEASPVDREAYNRWRGEDSSHEAAAARLEQSLGLFNSLPAADKVRTSASRALQAIPRRRMLRNTLAFGLTAVGSGLLLHRHQPVHQLFADAATATAERRRLTLSDGSQLLLNARSAVDLVFTRDARQIHLRAGELIVDVAPNLSHPLYVYSAEGCVSALGSRFLVRQDEGSSLVSVLRSTVQIHTGQGHEARLEEGASARFGRFGIQPETITPGRASAWEDGFIEIHDRPLAEVVAALRLYRPGLLRISKAAAELRVTGSFSLDNSDYTLAALANVLPIEVSYSTGYWVSIDLRRQPTSV